MREKMSGNGSRSSSIPNPEAIPPRNHNDAYRELLESYQERNEAVTTPEWEMYFYNRENTHEIWSICAKQCEEWWQIGRCGDCGTPLEPPKRQCAECFELAWIYWLKKTGQI